MEGKHPKYAQRKARSISKVREKNSIHHFRIDHNAPCLSPTHPPPPNFAKPLSWISAKTTVTPRRNRKQWLCKIFSGREWGGGVNKVLYGLCESSELYAKINQEHIILQSFNSIGTGVTYVYQYATERFQSRDQLLCQISCKKRKSFS